MPESARHVRPAAALDDCLAVLLDLDGVITPTADVHMLAWRRLFEAVFAERGIAPAYSDDDYFQHVDGRPRYDGVAAVLRSRDVSLPWGDPDDPPSAETVIGLGNRKNAIFTDILLREGVSPYPGSIAFIDRMAARGVRCAVVSSSRNATAVLAAAGLGDRFPLVVDGLTAAAEGLEGKPSPATYRYAADVLGVVPERAAVIEDAVSGVIAGAAGGFGLVVGVDRGAGAAALRAAGADLVVGDLIELTDD